MDTNESRRSETAALVETIWGRDAIECEEPVTPEVRALQNEALAIAIRIYLQSYLDDMRA